MPVLPVVPSPPHLTTSVRLPVESSDVLADAVNVMGPVAHVAQITALDSSNSPGPDLVAPHDCTPEELLMTLGRATAGPASLPAAALSTSALWALARYSWAFDANIAPGTDLVLDPASDLVRRHNRTSLSENLGIAAACWLTERYLLGSAPLVGLADVDNAIDVLMRMGIARGASGIGGPRPDYLYFLADATGIVDRVIVVECKGTAPRRGGPSRRDHVTGQLRDGVEQAVAWTVPSCSNQHFIFGSVLHDLRWTVHCVEALPPRSPEGRISGSPAASLVAAGAARLLMYSGMYRAAARLLREPNGSIELDPTAVREIAGLTVVGHSMLAESPVGLVELFHGVEQQTLAAIAGPEDGRAERMATAQQALDQERFSSGKGDRRIAPALRLELGPDTLGLMTRDGCVQLINRMAVMQ